MQEEDIKSIGIYLIYGKNGQQYGGMFTRGPNMPATPEWYCYIKVADTKATAETMTRLGGELMAEPMEVPGGGWIAIGADPQSARFAVHAAKT